MKHKKILILALFLLLAGILFMIWDMFFRKPGGSVNPYAYDIKTLQAGDTLVAKYAEVQQIKPDLKGIHGIATDLSDRIYIAGEQGVEIYNPAGKREAAFPVQGSARCIQVDRNGLIYLGMEDHLEIFSMQGRQLKRWKNCGIDALITSVAVTPEDVYIADAGNKIVCRYDLDGNFLRRIGEKDPQKNIPGFIIPSPWFDIGMDHEGSLWIVNPGRHRFEKFNRDGELLSSWGKATMAMDGFCGCCNPSHFAFLSDGSFVTSEKGIERIKIYSPLGDFRCIVATPAAFNEGTKGLDLAVDSKDRILVLDPERNQVRIFVMKK